MKSKKRSNSTLGKEMNFLVCVQTSYLIGKDYIHGLRKIRSNVSDIPNSVSYICKPISYWISIRIIVTFLSDDIPGG